MSHFLRSICILVGLLLISLIASQTSLRKIKRIAIIGSGPAGAGLAASLKVIDAGIDQIDVYESRSSPLQPSQGGGVQLSGGVVVLERLGLLSAFQRIAIPIKRVQTKDNLENPILNMSFDLESVAKLSKGQLIVDRQAKEPKPAIYAVMRDALQKFLYDTSKSNLHSKNCQVNYYSNMKCARIIEDSTSEKVQLEVESTAQNPTRSTPKTMMRDYDMVFGADGVRSIVNQYVATNQRSLIDRFLPSQLRYSGIRITFVVTPIKENAGQRIRSVEDTNTFTQRFGDNAYVLISTYGGMEGKLYNMMALVYLDAEDQSSGRRNWLSSADEPAKTESDPAAVKAKIKQRLVAGGFIAEELFAIVDGAEANRIVNVGLSDRYIPMAHWASRSNRVVLLGDAAHPMTPFLGQGANQALQDAYFLARGLKACNDIDDEQAMKLSLGKLMRDYQSSRKLFVTRLSITAAILGYVETLGGIAGPILRNNLFRFLNITGIAKYSFIDIATPRVD
jgi:salicylate hydroxylase